MRLARRLLSPLSAWCVLHAASVAPGFAADSRWPAGVDSTKLTWERWQPPMNGTERAVRMLKSTYSDYALEFERYFVRVTSRTDGVGEILRVTRKPDSGAAIWREDAPVDLTIEEWAGHFEGLEGDFLFIDSSTSPGPRGLIAFDLAHKKRVLDTMCLDHPLEPVLLGERWLTYLEDLGDWDPEPGELHPDCPNAQRWVREGMGPGFEEQVWFDLHTLRKTRSGIITCSRRQ